MYNNNSLCPSEWKLYIYIYAIRRIINRSDKIGFSFFFYSIFCQSKYFSDIYYNNRTLFINPYEHVCVLIIIRLSILDLFYNNFMHVCRLIKKIYKTSLYNHLNFCKDKLFPAIINPIYLGNLLNLTQQVGSKGYLSNSSHV